MLQASAAQTLQFVVFFELDTVLQLHLTNQQFSIVLGTQGLTGSEEATEVKRRTRKRIWQRIWMTPQLVQAWKREACPRMVCFQEQSS